MEKWERGEEESGRKKKKRPDYAPRGSNVTGNTENMMTW